ncbi:cyclic GMP-AMP synthase DncV-like nucleotidyltransferase [Sphingomonas yabuuchiae]|uniref:Cyclic GMP-AMP synthase n=2 Tax=Sphingomonas yabuuchiae TaxID=172044 RepID=A0AA41A3X7_9SPHN|nr:hypothetical protein [Sphingomonas yabuuchiae]MBB4608312.1 hypothetical protein [Sphingomonas yabuuchiae]MBN3559980.1 hypothetical protein [Sphingomonas yabuuchiae]
MFDCSKDVRAFHDKQVVLSQAEQTAMRDRRDANRRRLRKGLADNGKPAPIEFVKQGSYAMKTMLQHPQNDYDIDDGVYFRKDDLVGSRGAAMSALDARWMVRDALDDGSFNDAPEVRPNCVRVFYAAGFHVDVPVYRRVDTNGSYSYELASGAGWRRSDARDVTAWFDRELNASGQTYLLRRLVRHVKKFARSRSSWSGRILSGFGITVLVVENRHLDVARDDRAVHETMRAIKQRLDWNLVVSHPVTPGDTITSGDSDGKASFLRSKLDEALGWMEPLFEADCTREKALSCWDKVYNTDFFSARYKEERAAAFACRVGIGSAALMALEAPTAAAVVGAGGGRHA